MKPLEKKEWIYQANDFHCNRYIPKKINHYYPKFSEDYIKELIWNCSSSKNNRVEFIINEKYIKDWEEINKVVKYVQKKCNYY